jgi:hypothetical protein
LLIKTCWKAVDKWNGSLHKEIQLQESSMLPS